jgi:hypothetical protein
MKLLMFQSPPLRRLRIALATGGFLVGEDAFGLKAAAEPSQGFPPEVVG